MDSNNTRRAILKSVTGAGVASVGLSGLGSATEHNTTQTPPGVTRGSVTSSLNRHAKELLVVIHEDGLIDQPTIPNSDLQPRSVSEVASGKSGATRLEASSGNLLVSLEADGGTLNIFVNEDAGESYAVLVDTDADDPIFYLPGEGKVDPENLAEETGQVSAQSDCEDECVDPDGCFGEGTYEIRTSNPWIIPGCSVDVQCGCP